MGPESQMKNQCRKSRTALLYCNPKIRRSIPSLTFLIWLPFFFMREKQKKLAREIFYRYMLTFIVLACSINLLFLFFRTMAPVYRLLIEMFDQLRNSRHDLLYCWPWLAILKRRHIYIFPGLFLIAINELKWSKMIWERPNRLGRRTRKIKIQKLFF